MLLLLLMMLVVQVRLRMMLMLLVQIHLMMIVVMMMLLMRMMMVIIVEHQIASGAQAGSHRVANERVGSFDGGRRSRQSRMMMLAERVLRMRLLWRRLVVDRGVMVVVKLAVMQLELLLLLADCSRRR